MPRRLTEVIGANIAHTRNRRSWNQSDLAPRMNMALGTIGAIERGERDIRIDELARFCEVLDVTLPVLLDGLEPEQWAILGLTPPPRWDRPGQ